MIRRFALCAALLLMACGGSCGGGSCGAIAHLDGGAEEDGGVSGNGGGGDSGGSASGGSGRGGDGGGELTAGPTCLVSSVVAEIAVTNIDKIDLLFMVDNSGSMREEQAALRDQLPFLINMLTSGDRDGDGQLDFPAAKDLHVGIVSSDLGLVGISGIPGCEGLGDDGLLNNVASPEITGCLAETSSPRFLSYQADIDDPARLSTDFQCLAMLGTDGCGFQQQLESTLKAVWPGTDSRINFLPDPSGFGTTGQAGPNFPNGDFIRSNPAEGLSLVGLILVTDEEDCSSSNTSHFRPIDATIPQNDPLRQQGFNTRCFFENQRAEPNNIFDVTRYINGFKALREGNENLVFFGAIAGVPARLVTPERLSEVDFSNPLESDAFYDGILAAPEMQEMVDTRGTPEVDDDNLVPSCDVPGVGLAFPPRRLVQVAKGFGPNGFIQSICQEDWAPAMDVIVTAMSKQLGAVCLPRPLVRDARGLTDCNVIWELPLPGTSVAGTPTSCDQVPFLIGADRRSSSGRAICRVPQLAVQTEGGESETVPVEVDGETYDEGWYYDNFSESTQTECTGREKQRIAFSPGARPPTGVTVKLECVHTVFRSPTNPDAAPGVEQPSIGDPCEEVLRNGNLLQGDEACIVRLANGEEDDSMFCHPEHNICAQGCEQASECPDGWECDDSAETLSSTGGRSLCATPVCSVGPESSNAEHVGDPCLPTILPETGYDDSEAYIEASSRQCGGGVCLVYHLGGDPRAECIPSGDPSCLPTQSRPCGPIITCATPAEVEERVYCSCRCDAPEGLPECDCPGGFSCATALDNGGPEVRGGYCVRNRSVVDPGVL